MIRADYSQPLYANPGDELAYRWRVLMFAALRGSKVFRSYHRFLRWAVQRPWFVALLGVVWLAVFAVGVMTR